MASAEERALRSLLPGERIAVWTENSETGDSAWCEGYIKSIGPLNKQKVSGVRKWQNCRVATMVWVCPQPQWRPFDLESCAVYLVFGETLWKRVAQESRSSLDDRNAAILARRQLVAKRTTTAYGPSSEEKQVCVRVFVLNLKPFANTSSCVAAHAFALNQQKEKRRMMAKAVMGFPKTFKFKCSRSRACEQLGNAVVPVVVKKIAEQMLLAWRSTDTCDAPA